MLKTALLNPSFSRRSRTELLQRTLGGRGWSREVLNFLCLLVERGRLQGLAEMVEHYQEMMDEVEGRVKASVCSAIPLDNGEVTRIKTALEETLGKEVLLTTGVDPGLIGGATVSVKNMIIDGSIRTRLRQLSETLGKG
jgi:F-type H+-transporting ATPase subunit delta